MSQTNKMPTAEDHERVSGKIRKMVVISEERDKQFKSDAIYLTFFSYSGLALEILVSYSEEGKEAANKQN